MNQEELYFIPPKKLPLPVGGEWDELRYADSDYASVHKVQGTTYVVLPYRSTGLGATRLHFMRSSDPRPQTAFTWREHGVTYLAFPFSGQRIVSIYVSNSGITRVQVLEPDGRIIGLGKTTWAAALQFVEGMVRINRW